ncbi:metallophosphoesterase [Mechercharimyces sp. CAU 1602]|uniref:metallophosphoesterase n=1 Tax=Mechercharimyces sp. CAU 1602 TaxID=2973933 RepID=UPI002163D868|nr:metallophosphoesterase [Mechercharimyces sp. CAU 1602]MCS1350541.1 metallophosphoesterase [Mechercharimyces sp. CAU 1602]
MFVLSSIVAGTILSLWGFARLNTYRPEVNHIDLKVKRPLDKEGLRILHLSDLHMERLSVSPQSLKEYVSDGKPIDLIALTGDYMDTEPMIDRFFAYMDELASLKPRYGMYAVFGNHDYKIAHRIPEIRKRMEQYGCVVLQNENHTLNINGRTLNIIGIDDHHTRRSDAEKSYAGIDEENGINLVLTHDPNIVLQMENHSFDYLLSGHFHGGQIHWPRPYHLRRMGQLPKLKMIKGLHYHEERAFYISEGLGQTAFNLRLRSRPEITFHHLQKS